MIEGLGKPAAAVRGLDIEALDLSSRGDTGKGTKGDAAYRVRAMRCEPEAGAVAKIETLEFLTGVAGHNACGFVILLNDGVNFIELSERGAMYRVIVHGLLQGHASCSPTAVATGYR